MTEGGLLALDVRGRHRYYRIASADIAASLEALANVARAAAPHRPVPAPSRTVPAELRYARTCYDHMAGELAVRIFDGHARGWLLADGDAIETTELGAQALAQWGIDVAQQHARCSIFCTLDRTRRTAARAARHRARTAGFRRVAYVRLTPGLRLHDNGARSTGFVTSRAIRLTKHRALKQAERIL